MGNQIHKRIQLELRCANDKIEFLDVLTTIRDGFLATDLFTKPTEKHLYLRRDSSHPKSTMKAIPYGLGVRAKRICSDETSYHRHRHSIKSQLKQRGYDEDFVEGDIYYTFKNIFLRNSLVNYKRFQHICHYHHKKQL